MIVQKDYGPGHKPGARVFYMVGLRLHNTSCCCGSYTYLSTGPDDRLCISRGCPFPVYGKRPGFVTDAYLDHMLAGGQWANLEPLPDAGEQLDLLDLL